MMKGENPEEEEGFYQHHVHHQHCRSRRNRRIATFAVATIAIVFTVIILLIIFFSVLKPKNPQITVNEVQVPSIEASDPPESTVNMTVSVYLTVKNSNMAEFRFSQGSMEVSYRGNQIAFMYIPADKVGGRRSHPMALTLLLEPFTARLKPDYDPSATPNSTSIALDSQIRLPGRVSVLHLFRDGVEALSHCQIRVSVINASAPSFSCSDRS